jgi:hypothetical protein
MWKQSNTNRGVIKISTYSALNVSEYIFRMKNVFVNISKFVTFSFGEEIFINSST